MTKSRNKMTIDGQEIDRCCNILNFLYNIFYLFLDDYF
jgi:hypothetical protein